MKLRLLRNVEWGLIITLGIFLLVMLVPGNISKGYGCEGMKHCIKVNTESQTYFDKDLQVDFIKYTEEELRIYLSVRGGNFPGISDLYIETDKGDVLQPNQVSTTMQGWRANGWYGFSDPPKGIKEITFFADRYGESFLFTLPVEGGEDIE